MGAVCTLSGLKGVEDCREIAVNPMRRERSLRERGGTGRKRGEKGKGERRTAMKVGKEAGPGERRHNSQVSVFFLPLPKTRSGK